MLSLSGCIQFAAPPPAPCPIKTLLIDTSQLDGNEWEEIGSRNTRGAPRSIGIERIGTSFSTPTQGVAVNHVYRFIDDERAVKGYKDRVDSWFKKMKTKTKWILPSVFRDLVLSTDNFELGCSILSRGPSDVERCQYIGHYGPYVTEISADMLALTYDDFAVIILDIDQRMTKCLHK